MWVGWGGGGGHAVELTLTSFTWLSMKLRCLNLLLSCFLSTLCECVCVRVCACVRVCVCVCARACGVCVGRLDQ